MDQESVYILPGNVMENPTVLMALTKQKIVNNIFFFTTKTYVVGTH